MADLIDRKALLEKIQFRIEPKGIVGETVRDMVETTRRIIEEAPAVEPTVKHGEWIMCLDENDCEFIECPLCGEQFYDGDNDTFDRHLNYCPNCGAKMDGGNDGF